MTVTVPAGLSSHAAARSDTTAGRNAGEGDAFRNLLDRQSHAGKETANPAAGRSARGAKTEPGSDDAADPGRPRGNGELAGDRHGRTHQRRQDADAEPALGAALRDSLPLLISLGHLSATALQEQPAREQDNDPEAGGDLLRPAMTDGPDGRPAAERQGKHLKPTGMAQAEEISSVGGGGASTEAGPAEASLPASPSRLSDPAVQQRPSPHAPTEAAGQSGAKAQAAITASVRVDPSMRGPRQHLPSSEAVPDTAGDAESEAAAPQKGRSADRDSITRDIVSARSGLDRDPVFREKQSDRNAAPPAGDGRRAGDQARTVTVTASQSFAPPASLPVNPTTAALVSAIGADNGFRQAAANAMLPGTVAAPAHLLKIELHPAELGSVTASLRLSGEQLSVELKPESHEAYRRLSADADEIRKSLHRLGLSVDTVTVLQPQIAAPAATRADMAAASGQNQPSFQSGGSGNDGDGQGSQQPGRNRNDGRQDSPHGAPTSRTRSGDLFI